MGRKMPSRVCHMLTGGFGIVDRPFFSFSELSGGSPSVAFLEDGVENGDRSADAFVLRAAFDELVQRNHSVTVAIHFLK